MLFALHKELLHPCSAVRRQEARSTIKLLDQEIVDDALRTEFPFIRSLHHISEHSL